MLWSVEFLVDYFSRYHILKNISEDTDLDYQQACGNLEQMGNHFKRIKAIYFQTPNTGRVILQRLDYAGSAAFTELRNESVRSCLF